MTESFVDRILSIPQHHLSKRGSWIATVTGLQPISLFSRSERYQKVGLSLALQNDPTFTSDRIFFSPTALFKAIEQSQKGQIFYYEDVYPAGTVRGIPFESFTEKMGCSLTGLLLAVKRREIGLIYVASVMDQHLSQSIQRHRNSAIIMREGDEEDLATSWFECRLDTLYGRTKRILKYLVIDGKRIPLVYFPRPPEDLLRAYHERVEEYLEIRNE